MRHYPAKPTVVNGVTYDSRLEARMAEILIKANVPFVPHARFEVRGPEGIITVKEVDFLLKRLVQPIWSSHFIMGIECKGWLSPKDYQRLHELEAVGVPTYIATQPIIDFWYRYGFLQHTLGHIIPSK